MVSVCGDGGPISHSHVEVPGFCRSSSAAPFSVFTCVSALCLVCVCMCVEERAISHTFLGG